MRGVLDRLGVAREVGLASLSSVARSMSIALGLVEHLEEPLLAEREGVGRVRQLLLEPRGVLGERGLARVERGRDLGGGSGNAVRTSWSANSARPLDCMIAVSTHGFGIGPLQVRARLLEVCGHGACTAADHRRGAVAAGA